MHRTGHNKGATALLGRAPARWGPTDSGPAHVRVGEDPWSSMTATPSAKTLAGGIGRVGLGGWDWAHRLEWARAPRGRPRTAPPDAERARSLLRQAGIG